MENQGFVIKWLIYGFVTKQGPGGRYAQDPYARETKVWKTYKNAERWLDGRDKTYASQCAIIARR